MKARHLYARLSCHSNTDELARADIQLIVDALSLVEQQTLIDAIEAAINHTSPVMGEECSGCEVVAAIRKLAMKAGEG